MRRWEVLRPHVQDGVPLSRAARDAGVAPRTAQRWLAAFRAGGLAALGRPSRVDAGRLRTQTELVEVIQGLALTRPRPSVATITRKTAALAAERSWAAPAYSTVREIVTTIDPHLLSLAHDGPTGFRDRYELVHRRQADRPNQIWQADHTKLDVLVRDERGDPARPWLTVLIDDCSRAVCGYTVFLGAPSALNLSLALRQAVRPKADPGWVVSGLPEVLYADHGSDFASDHLRRWRRAGRRLRFAGSAGRCTAGRRAAGCCRGRGRGGSRGRGSGRGGCRTCGRRWDRIPGRGVATSAGREGKGKRGDSGKARRRGHAANRVKGRRCRQLRTDGRFWDVISMRPEDFSHGQKTDRRDRPRQ